MTDQPDISVETDRFGLRLAAAIVFAGAAIAVYVRIHFSIDFTDESFYVALPYSFTLGHRPLQDELSVHQFAGLLLVPPVKAYLSLVGSSHGLVLFMRHLYFLSALLCAYLVTSRLGRVVGPSRALAFSALLLAYIPFGIPNLSYNTIGYFGLMSGLIWVAFSDTSKRPWLDLLLGTFALSLASVAYPTLSLATLGCLIAVLWTSGHGAKSFPRIRTALPVLGVGLLWILASSYIAVAYDAKENLPRLLELNRLLGAQGGGLGKLSVLWVEFTEKSPMFLMMLLILAGVGLAFRRVRSSIALGLVVSSSGVFLMAAASLNPPRTEPFTTTTFLISTLAFLSIYSLWPAGQGRKNPYARSLAILIVASVVAGITILWSTANGWRNAALGFAPASLVGLGVITASLPGFGRSQERRPASDTPFSGRAWAVILLAASLLIYELSQFPEGVYRDQPLQDLDSRVAGGPYAGLITTSARRDFIQTLSDTLAEQKVDKKTILFFDYFPAGYLLSDLRPTTAALWMFPSNPLMQGNPRIRIPYAEVFEDRSRLPDLAVVMKLIPAGTRMIGVPPPSDDPVLKRLEADEYVLVSNTPFYFVLSRVSRASD